MDQDLEALDEGEQPVPEGQASEPLLVVESLGRSYGETRALDGLSFQVAPGEVLGLVGPNGAGKTTALRSIAGILPIKEGRVRIAGHDVQHAEVQAKQHLGWVPDDPQPFETLTVEEHLEFTAALYQVEPWRERAERLLETFELSAKRGALGGELSRGMRQKLAFACAWLPQPKVVLLDEPLSGLDPLGIRSARTAIEELAASGTAVILSSHQLELVEALASRLLIVNQGKQVYLGTLAEARKTLSVGDTSSLEEIFFAATALVESSAESDAFEASLGNSSSDDPFGDAPADLLGEDPIGGGDATDPRERQGGSQD